MSQSDVASTSLSKPKPPHEGKAEDDIPDSWEDEADLFEVKETKSAASPKLTTPKPDIAQLPITALSLPVQKLTHVKTSSKTFDYNLFNQNLPFLSLSRVQGSVSSPGPPDERPAKTMATANRLIGMALGMKIQETPEKKQGFEEQVRVEKEKREKEKRLAKEIKYAHSWDKW